MTNIGKKITTVLLAAPLVVNLAYPRGIKTLPEPPFTKKDFDTIQSDLQKSYLDLFALAPEVHYSPDQIEKMRAYLHDAQSYCVSELKAKSDAYKSEIKQDENSLNQKTDKKTDQKIAELSDGERHDLHCSIQNDEKLKSQTDVVIEHAMPLAYENKQAKLELLEKWPADYERIHQEKQDGSYRNRRWGNVEDIGFRTIADGQEKDIKTGEDAIKQMKESGLMPDELKNKAVVDYVDQIAQKVAAHSDLKVPLKVTVLDDKKINAFALPGGFLYVNRGLVEAADDESELAGVLAHEIGHDTARHAHSLMKKAEIASIMFQAAEVAVGALTGGVASLGTYYAIQYGFYGLDMALNLELLGVSREYELQADQLGIQYAWNSGYDPTGFIRFFDKMATKEGFVRGVSWFHDHPPFYQRMVDAEREILFLPKKDDLVVTTTDFSTMKSALTEHLKKNPDMEKNRPTLIRREKGCTDAPKLDLSQLTQNIAPVCSLPNPEEPAD